MNTYVYSGANAVVDKVNGIKVTSLKHFKEVIDKSTDDYIRIDYIGMVTPTFLDLKKVREADEEIAKQYSIKPKFWFN